MFDMMNIKLSEISPWDNSDSNIKPNFICFSYSDEMTTASFGFDSLVTFFFQKIHGYSPNSNGILFLNN